MTRNEERSTIKSFGGFALQHKGNRKGVGGMKTNMNIAVVFAGGVGRRMNSKDIPKQFLELYNKPIIIHTLEHFENHPMIDAIVVVCVEEWIGHLEQLLFKYRIDKVKKIVSGGATGQLSIYNGLNAANELAYGKNAIVLIHDGVRPLINEQLITENIECVLLHGSAITTAPEKETIVVVDEKDENVTDHILVRDRLRIARAPQSFWLSEILQAHNESLKNNMTDFIDSGSMMHYYGKKLHLINGPSDNIKVTTPDDFYSMRAILEAKENAQLHGYNE